MVDALDGIYHTSRAETAAAAMECLRAGGIDAMLLDCTLPGGLDPHLVPMADDTGVPVILMSGHPDMMERVPGVPRPCIQKPFSLTALLATIEQRHRRQTQVSAAQLSRATARPADAAARETSARAGTAWPGTPRWRAAAACR